MYFVNLSEYINS